MSLPQCKYDAIKENYLCPQYLYTGRLLRPDPPLILEGSRAREQMEVHIPKVKY